MNEPNYNQKAMDRLLFQGVMEAVVTCKELKLVIGNLHERLGLDDSDKVIGEMNHRIRKQIEEEWIRFENSNSSFAAWLASQGGPAHESPPPHP